MKKKSGNWILRVFVLCSVGLLFKWAHLDLTLFEKVTQ